jgi:hypothetical protein
MANSNISSPEKFQYAENGRTGVLIMRPVGKKSDGAEKGALRGGDGQAFGF